jgi:hypothetical protein
MKGKLQCPGCGTRVGGFDFVGGHSKPVYIVKSKVWQRITSSVVDPDVWDRVRILILALINGHVANLLVCVKALNTGT